MKHLFCLITYKQGNDSLNYSDNYLLDFIYSTFLYFDDIGGGDMFLYYSIYLSRELINALSSQFFLYFKINCSCIGVK